MSCPSSYLSISLDIWGRLGALLFGIFYCLEFCPTSKEKNQDIPRRSMFVSGTLCLNKHCRDATVTRDEKIGALVGKINRGTVTVTEG